MTYTRGLRASAAALLLLFPACGGGDDPLPPLFEPQPECEGAPIAPFAGDHQNVMSVLSIGTETEGFDLDGDGMPDNKLAAVGGFANDSLADAVARYDLMIPIELFDLPAVGGADECVKLGLYLGVYKHDTDGDGRATALADADCDDTRGTSRDGMPELAGNFVDDDCDGLADEADDGSASGDVVDHDADGVTLAAGDCDDSTTTGAMVRPGLAEICGDGLDNDCDQHADSGATCDPYTTVQTIGVDPASLDGGAPAITFTNGAIAADGTFTAGPSLFRVTVPVLGLELDLRISGAQIVGELVADGDGVTMRGRLGGVIDSQTADNIRGLEYEDVGLLPENTLLDAVYANLLGTFLSLKVLGSDSGHPGCKLPDIDVDRDGFETFCDTNPDDENKTVDLCVDGDGTEIRDEVDADGNVTTDCTKATLPDGTPRFVDGISVELNFETVKTILREP